MMPYRVVFEACPSTEIVHAGTQITELYDDLEKALARVLEIDRSDHGRNARLLPLEGMTWEQVAERMP